MGSDNSVKKNVVDERCLDMVGWLERNAEQLITEGSVREGLSVYYKLLQIGRDDDELLERTHLRMAEVLLENGDLYGAETHLRETLNVNPDNAYGLCLLGRLCLDVKDWSKAAKCGFHACLLDPDVSDYHQLFGRALLCGGNVAEGCDELEIAIELDPDNIIAICDLALAYAQQLQFDDAKKLLLDTMDRHPANSVLRDAMISVQKRYDTVGTRKKTKKRHNTFSNRSQQIAHDLLVKDLEKVFSQDEIECAVRLLEDVVNSQDISIENPAILAATCKYTISRILGVRGITQKRLADEYGVSAATISKKYRAIVQQFWLVPNDARYTPLPF